MKRHIAILFFVALTVSMALAGGYAPMHINSGWQGKVNPVGRALRNDVPPFVYSRFRDHNRMQRHIANTQQYKRVGIPQVYSAKTANHGTMASMAPMFVGDDWRGLVNVVGARRPWQITSVYSQNHARRRIGLDPDEGSNGSDIEHESVPVGGGMWLLFILLVLYSARNNIHAVCKRNANAIR